MTDNRSPDERLFPIQLKWHRPSEGGKVNEAVYMAAYEVYSGVFRPQPALIQGNCRGGFGTSELIAFLYARAFPKAEWRARVDEALRRMENL